MFALQINGRGLKVIGYDEDQWEAVDERATKANKVQHFQQTLNSTWKPEHLDATLAGFLATKPLVAFAYVIVCVLAKFLLGYW